MAFHWNFGKAIHNAVGITNGTFEALKMNANHFELDYFSWFCPLLARLLGVVQREPDDAPGLEIFLSKKQKCMTFLLSHRVCSLVGDCGGGDGIGDDLVGVGLEGDPEGPRLGCTHAYASQKTRMEQRGHIPNI